MTIDEQEFEPTEEPISEEQEVLSEVEILQREVDEWKDLAARRTAEVENIRRRSRQREEELTMYAAERIITQMLPILDDMHAAIMAADKSNDIEALKAGMNMIYSKANKVFDEAGVTTIEGGEGQPYDVNLHEALMHTPSDVPEGHVVQVIQRGYQLYDKVLRHAKVITSAGKE